MKKYIFFDLDNTLTPSRSPIGSDMEDALRDLMAVREVIVVSGAQAERIVAQIGSVFSHDAWILAQNGNHAVAKEGLPLWYDAITDKREILAHIERLQSLLESTNDDMVEDRGCQISFSCIGQHADMAIKRLFDPDFSRRRRMLETYPFSSAGFEVRIGGTTNFDYIKKGMHKGSNVRKLADRNNWSLSDCLYIGDALFPGGNDEAVIGVCDTRAVSGPHETVEVIRELLKQ